MISSTDCQHQLVQTDLVQLCPISHDAQIRTITSPTIRTCFCCHCSSCGFCDLIKKHKCQSESLIIRLPIQSHVQFSAQLAALVGGKVVRDHAMRKNLTERGTERTQPKSQIRTGADCQLVLSKPHCCWNFCFLFLD